MRLGRRGSPRSLSLSTRLLIAQLLVVLTGALTAWIVGSAVAPALFHRHMLQAAEAEPGADAAAMHAEQAFQSANAISLTMALLAALTISVAVSLYLARRLGHVVTPLSAATNRVARGDYRARVALPGLGVEFDRLAAGFNQMAERLDQIETTRRRMLGDLAHELRTPLAVLDAYLEALQDGVASPDTPTIGLLREQTARMTRFAQDVSSLSRAEEHQLPLRLSTITAAALVQAAVTGAQGRYDAKSVQLTTILDADAAPLTLDTERMGQVLSNLLDNALRHTAPEGAVVVSVTARPDGVRIQVRDNGEGISAEHLSHVFERFYRADPARDRAHGGSGIGLAIVKAVVEEHHGSVTASSDGPGQGACFTIDLPPAPQTART